MLVLICLFVFGVFGCICLFVVCVLSVALLTDLLLCGLPLDLIVSWVCYFSLYFGYVVSLLLLWSFVGVMAL